MDFILLSFNSSDSYVNNQNLKIFSLNVLPLQNKRRPYLAIAILFAVSLSVW